jgi:general secretion pathway protein K
MRRRGVRSDRRAAGPVRQGGAAVIVALLVVALTTTIVAGLYLRENVTLRGIENRLALSQVRWIERAALDWARVILRADAASGSVDHLGEPWAVPVADTRLDETVTAGARLGDTARPATLSGRIVDAQSMLNLNALVQGDRPSALALASLRRLLLAVGQPETLADVMLARVLAGQPRIVDGRSGPGSALPLLRVDDLRDIPGFSAGSLEALRPFVTVLPGLTPVNINTAPPEVLTAVVPDLDLAAARRFVARRERAVFRSLDEAASALDGQPALPAGQLSVNSSYFLVRGVIRFDRVEAVTEALLARNGQKIELLWQQRH